MKIKPYIPWAIRILIFLIFMVSGVAKLFPIWAFEKQLVDLGITSWCYAPYLSRLIIALELSIGILILQPHFLKRIVIPGTILLLLAFCVHLTIEMIAHGAMVGNCGCFGQLIPMTPLEAFIKNIITIGLLIYLFRIVKEKEKGKNKFIFLIFTYAAVALILFMLFPFCPCKNSETIKQPILVSDTVIQMSTLADSTAIDKPLAPIQNNAIKSTGATLKNPEVMQAESGPKRVKSRYSAYTSFGNEKVNLDEGKKIICFFAAGCDHCRVAAREINMLSKKIELPPVYIFFMDEETDLIPDFFKEAGGNFPYTILEVPVFWELLGMNSDTPGVTLLWNGNLIRYYEGTEKNKFDVADFEKAIKSI